MKFKKEYRWLLFLVIPFVIFMFILFMVPLEIVLTAQPLATQTYNLQKTQNTQTTLRSAALQTSSAMNSFFSQFYSIFSLYEGSSSEFLSANVNEITINNGYSFYNNNNGEIRAQRSMWFTKNIFQSINLSSWQNDILTRYLQSEIQIRSLYKNRQVNKSSIIGIYNYYDGKGINDMVFYFPSYHEINYSSLTNTIDRKFYQSMLNYYNINNISYILTSQFNRYSLAKNLITICKLRFNLPGFICIDIDADIFQTEWILSNLANKSVNTYLLTFNLTSLKIIFNLTQSNSIVNSSEEYKIISALNFISSPPGVKIMGISRWNKKSYFINTILLWDSSRAKNNILGYYLLESDQSSASVELQSSDVVNSSLNSLLIPTIILIVISLIVSVVVLRSLMNGLDLQLHKLNQRCKFILDGDLQIEIPQYNGTKDIYQVYQQVKIINKLHRYTNKDYFVGHFSNRILKYNQALEVIKKLGYDPSNLMENIGQAYIYIEQYDKAIHYLKESVHEAEIDIDQQFGGLDKMFYLKQERQKISMVYRQLEMLLIRRLWKLVFCLFKYVQLQIINAKQLDQQNLTEEQKTQKKQRLQKQTLDYITKLKKAMYPDFKSYAESCMLLNFQIKFLISIKNFDGAKECLSRCLRVTQAYGKQYDEISKKLKQKGSKNLYFFRKNKLSGHSRSSPNIMDAFYLYTRGIILTSDPQGKDYYTAAVGFLQGLKKNLASHSVNYLLVNEIKKLMGTLKLSLQKFETTQLFRQSMPYKTLHYGAITKQIQPTLYRVARNPAQVQCRQYMIILDASYYYSSEQELTQQLIYIKQRSEYLYDKLIKKFDRISLIQSNSQIGLQTICNLTLKQGNQKVIRKSLLDMANYKSFTGKNQLISTIQKVIFRIKNLQCQKIIIIFLKYIDSYLDQRVYKGKNKHRSKSKIKYEGKKYYQVDKSICIEQIGEDIEEVMSVQGLRNCKLILMCGVKDDYERLHQVFSIKNINSRIWSRIQGLNKANNVVYVVDDKHKSDLDRILMSKLPSVSDNHVFAL